MSFFADFILADKREAAKVAASSSPAENWPGISFKNLNCLDMAALYGVLLRKTTEDEIIALLWDSFEELSRRDDAIDLRLFSAEFTALLAAIAPTQLGPVTRAWRAAEEKIRRWTSEGNEEVLGGLCQLARRAMREQKPIMIYVTGFYTGQTETGANGEANGDILPN